MPSSDARKGFAATKRVFTRPANLHLAWSTSKGIPSPFDNSAPLPTISKSTSGTPRLIPRNLSNPTQNVAPLPSHPYNSFSLRSEDDWNADSYSIHSSSSAMYRTSSASSKKSWASTGADSSRSILKSGHLTWKSSRDDTGRGTLSNGFEKALRRRQVGKGPSYRKDQIVFAALEQLDTSSGDGKFPASVSSIPASRQHSFSSIPYLASPGACDPSAFDNDSLVSLVSPSVTSSLEDQSRWTPPPCWDIFDTDYDSQSRSSGSASSDLLQTPTSSQPNSPKEQDTFLCIYSPSASSSSSARQSSPLMKLQITQESTVEMQQSFSGHAAEVWEGQLIVTGDLVSTSKSQSTYVGGVQHIRSSTLEDSITTSGTCILSSPNIAELDEWLFCIEDAIKRCQIHVDEESLATRRRSSASMLDTIRLLEQLEVKRNSAQHLQGPTWPAELKDQNATPTAATHTLPSASLSVDTGISATTSAFSPSSFIDYYATSPGDTRASSTANPTSLYSFEDAYTSIMQRYSDYTLASPLDALPSAPLNGLIGHARSDCDLDVPVSPCSYEFAQDYWEQDEDAPGSPVDPWMSHHAQSAVQSRKLSDTSGCSFDDETVMRIFAEGFRRRSSAGMFPADN